MSTLFEGKTIEEALEKAASALGADRGELQHEVVEEKTDDFWGLGEKVLVVRAWVPGREPVTAAPAPPPAPAAPAAAAAPAPSDPGDEVPDFFRATPSPAPAARPSAPAPRAERPVREAERQEATPREPLAPAQAGELTSEAEALLKRIFDSMGFSCRGEARLDGDTLHVAISGDDNTFLLEERGRGLSALELVLNHALRHRTDHDRLRIRVDAEDFRSQREDELRDMAFQLAHRAKETGDEQTTTPMNAYERRIVHLTLADDPGVTTRSLGHGFTKAVCVIPTGGAGRRR